MQKTLERAQFVTSYLRRKEELRERRQVCSMRVVAFITAAALVSLWMAGML